MSKDSNGTYYQRLHALDLLSLQDRPPALAVQASAAGNGPNSSNGVVSFDSKQYKERGALLLWHGQVVTEWASHCDITPVIADGEVLIGTPSGVAVFGSL